MRDRGTGERRRNRPWWGGRGAEERVNGARQYATEETAAGDRLAENRRWRDVTREMLCTHAHSTEMHASPYPAFPCSEREGGAQERGCDIEPKMPRPSLLIFRSAALHAWSFEFAVEPRKGLFPKKSSLWGGYVYSYVKQAYTIDLLLLKKAGLITLCSTSGFRNPAMKSCGADKGVLIGPHRA